MPGPHRRKDDRLVFGDPYKQPYRSLRRTRADNFRRRCLTLEEDEITRCGKPLTRGERCQVHQVQYRAMYLNYKDASRRAKDLRQTDSIPSKGYNNFDLILRKIEHVYKYRELVQIERIGRDIHGRRFFLKRDDPHRIRLEYLEKEVERSSEAILALQERANSLRVEDSRWQTDSSLADFDFSGNLGERTPGAPLQMYFATRNSGEPTNDATSTTISTDSESDCDLELIEVESSIAAMTLANLFYASVDYFFSK